MVDFNLCIGSIDKTILAKKLKIKIPNEWPVSPEAIPVFNEISQSDETIVG